MVNLSRRELLEAGVGLAGTLFGCKTITPMLSTAADFASKTYDDLVGIFMERTRASYFANGDGAIATYHAPDGSEMKIVDGYPEGLSEAQKTWLELKSWLGGDNRKYDGVPDQVTINRGGVSSNYDHRSGVYGLVVAAEDLKRINFEVGKYMGMFSSAIVNDEITYEDPVRYGDQSIVANLGRTKIIARANSDSINTDLFQVYRDENKIVEIIGTPDLFSDSMKDLVAAARIKLGGKAAQEIIDKL